MSTTTTTQISTTTTRLTADQPPPSEDTQPSSNSSNSISTTQQTPNSTTKTQQRDPTQTTPTTPPPPSTAETEDLEIYDEIEIEDMTYDATLRIYHYPCPCGDRFEIGVDAMRERGEDVAVCPGCSLMVRVVYDVGDLPKT